MTIPCNGDGPFERPEYLRASAAHEGSEPVVIAAGPARLTLLRAADGGLHSVYGYPHPVGQLRDADFASLAAALSGIDAPLRIALSPLGCGAALASHLVGKLPIAFERSICIADLDADPLAAFGPKARGMVRRTLGSGVIAEIGPVTPEFGALYGSAMDVLQADPLYHFDQAYFAALGAAGAFEVAARDAHGICAAALFLVGGREASYHLSARRSEPPAEAGAANLLVLEGLRECARRGATACILGGGKSEDAEDPLLRFKTGMATRILPRPTFERGAE